MNLRTKLVITGLGVVAVLTLLAFLMQSRTQLMALL
jgi:hypothetical protein